jgi:hypothetical protein
VTVVAASRFKAPPETIAKFATSTQAYPKQYVPDCEFHMRLRQSGRCCATQKKQQGIASVHVVYTLLVTVRGEYVAAVIVWAICAPLYPEVEA